MRAGQASVGAAAVAASAHHAASKSQMLDHLGARIELGARVSNSVRTAVRESERRMDESRLRVTDKSDRATVEQVLDPRTRLILLKMLNRGVLSEINGCVSTGKEANVYYAPGPNGAEFAVKVFKTSILVFKDRERYVSGDFRFRRGYSKHNPRKMVAAWAEKEARNLHRLALAGIRVPKLETLRTHVLVMEFLGKDGWPAPRLKDAQVSSKRFAELYVQMVKVMRRMFQRAKLVHGDLSEYNILYHRKQAIVIDVSQSVEHDHPRALEFLRMDCRNITHFFYKTGNVQVMSMQQLFYFVTDTDLTDETEDAYLQEILEKAKSEPVDLDAVDEQVFLNAFIPRSLGEVIDHERDIERRGHGDTKDLFYPTIGGLTDEFAEQHLPDAGAMALETPAHAPAADAAAATVAASTADGAESDGDDGAAAAAASDSDDSGSGSDSGGEGEEGDGKRDIGMELASMDRKARKELVKQMKRDKRMVKVPKKVKRRHKTLATRGHH